MAEQYGAIVIGSGIGGLTAAAFLAKGGVRPLILEKHFLPGGNAMTFRRKKMFDFDVGFHYIGSCDPGGFFPTILEQLGVADRVEFVPLNPDSFDTIHMPDLIFHMPAGWERYRQRLHEAFPQEAQAIDRYVDFMMTAAGRAPSPGRQPLRELLGKPASQCTLAEAFDALEMSQPLRHLLGYIYGTYAAPPSKVPATTHAAVLDHYIQGAYFVRGGGRPIVEALLSVIEAGGGEVRLRAKVERIIVEGGKAVGVKLDSGQELRAPIVLSNADAKRTFLEMVGEEHLSAAFAERVKGYRMALPLFIIYMVMEVDPSELGLSCGNLYLLPAYNVEEQFAACYEGRLPDRPAVFIPIASLKDPLSENIAPKGYTNLQLMSVAPAQPQAWGVSKGPASGGRYRHTPAYVAAKREMEARMLGVVEEMMPGFIRKVVWQESASPLTQERFTLSTGGTSYGLEHSLDQAMPVRVPYQTELPGLWMVGASTLFGHGYVGCMMGGRTAATMILQQSR
ncbi:MAG: phytoene desaturase family protein [Dehalococcoidia bacterium]